MSLLELSQSNDPEVRLRAEVRTFTDLASWISTGNSRMPASLSDNAKPVSNATAKFNDSFINQLIVSDKVTVMVMPGSEWGAFNRMHSLIGSYNMYSDAMGKIWHCGVLAAKEWPFLTVELVAYCLREQQKIGRTNVPSMVAAHLPHFFDNVDYKELMHWHQNGLMSLTPDNKDLPVLSDIMFERAMRLGPTPALLPSDMSL